jgi:hypothetical protein
MRWRLAQHRLHASSTDSTCLTAGQSGRVWFLDGNEPLQSISRACTIPRGDYLLHVGPGWGCGSIEFSRPVSDVELERCARFDWSHAGITYAVELDGATLKPPGFLVATPQFAARFPVHDSLVLRAHSHTSGREVFYGYVMILRPLAPGHHRLVSTEHWRGEPTLTVTYVLTVR